MKLNIPGSLIAAIVLVALISLKHALFPDITVPHLFLLAVEFIAGVAGIFLMGVAVKFMFLVADSKNKRHGWMEHIFDQIINDADHQ